MIDHYSIQLNERRRGIYLVTSEILGELPSLPEKGLLHIFIQHTSAGLTINENADPSVRIDFESYLNDIVQENKDFITHDIEGPDDMPAHVKSSFVGSSVSIPINDGRLLLGIWQGIYLCEFRDRPHRRRVIATIYS